MSTVIASATGKYLTTCRLCQRRVAESPALDIPIIGRPGKRTQELMTVLLKHLNKHHSHELQAGAALYAEFQPFMILSAFEYEDPTMGPRLENIRAAIFGIVRKNGPSDEELDGLVSALKLDTMGDILKVNSAMRAIRDACCELGQFGPKVPEQSKIITG
jgi:hypothetical protein